MQRYSLFYFILWFLFFLHGAAVTSTLVATTPNDFIHGYDFEKRIFSSHPIKKDIVSPVSAIGESKYGTLNNRILDDFDDFVHADTTILYIVADYFDASDYPFSSAVKLQVQKGDTLHDICSGVMISDYWMVTANHCSNIREAYVNKWPADSVMSIYASPAYHHGKPNPELGTIKVERALFFTERYRLSNYPDLIFLRLSEPAGRVTGTIEMRSTAKQDMEDNQTVLSFGYPGQYIWYSFSPNRFDNYYNADTLYFYQCVVKYVDDLGINCSGHANPGQSGSPVLMHSHGEWAVYSVLSSSSVRHTFSHNLNAVLSQNIQRLITKYDDPYRNETLDDIHLLQNYPNPFNSSTFITYQISLESHVRLEIYDVLGREVAVLVDEVQSTGRYTRGFDAGNLSSGVYLYRLTVGGLVETRQMTLIK
ncbi:T9SS type A sorting domain-containing protein [Balneolaceae bacterium ANBcel3]|nr:T9SS type A sorting domain-containing protein [Balneolaceae bacterium ANBcel3]